MRTTREQHFQLKLCRLGHADSKTHTQHSHYHELLHSLELLLSVWLLSFVFGVMLLPYFTALPPFPCQSYPAKVSCPDNSVILIFFLPCIIILICAGREKREVGIAKKKTKKKNRCMIGNVLESVNRSITYLLLE